MRNWSILKQNCSLNDKLQWLILYHSIKDKYSKEKIEKVYEDYLSKLADNMPNYYDVYKSSWLVVVTNVALYQQVVSKAMTLEEFDKALARLKPLERIDGTGVELYKRFGLYYGLKEFILDYLSGSNPVINAILTHDTLRYSINYNTFLTDTIRETEFNRSSSCVIKEVEQAFVDYIIKQLVLEERKLPLTAAKELDDFLHKYGRESIWVTDIKDYTGRTTIEMVVEFISIPELYNLLDWELPKESFGLQTTH